MQTYICQNAPYFAVWNQVRMSKSEKMGRKTQRLHSPVKNKMFCAAWNNKSRGRKRNGTGDRQEAFTSEKQRFCAVWNKVSSMQSDVSRTKFGDQKV